MYLLFGILIVLCTFALAVFGFFAFLATGNPLWIILCVPQCLVIANAAI